MKKMNEKLLRNIIVECLHNNTACRALVSKFEYPKLEKELCIEIANNIIYMYSKASKGE